MNASLLQLWAALLGSEGYVRAQLDLARTIEIAQARSPKACRADCPTRICPVGVVEYVQEFSLQAELPPLSKGNDLGKR